MVVVLPVHGQNNQKLSTIHLYPKNEENDYPDPPFEKVLEEPRNDFTIGEKITYSLHTTIPVNILDYQKFELSDSADEALTFLPNSLTMSSNGQKAISILIFLFLIYLFRQTFKIRNRR